MTQKVSPGGLLQAAPEQISLNAGDVVCRAEPTILTTVLGSCVAVWLWDRTKAIGGLNHFALPAPTRGDRADETVNCRYGDTAMNALIAGLRALGGRERDFEAKVFGGARVLPSERGETVGELNVLCALSRLHDARIKVVAQRTGGPLGQQIRCYTETNAVLLRYLPIGQTTPGGRRALAERASHDPVLLPRTSLLS